MLLCCDYEAIRPTVNWVLLMNIVIYKNKLKIIKDYNCFPWRVMWPP